jgi:hypothetical protein
MLFVRRLIWDTWNIAHIARHDVIPEEVEEGLPRSAHHQPDVQRPASGGRADAQPPDADRHSGADGGAGGVLSGHRSPC